MRAPTFRASSRQLLEVGHRHAELGVRTGRAHMMMMSSAHAGIDAHEDLAIAEQAPPFRQRVQVVDRDLHAALERPGILLARGEVRRVEHAAADRGPERARALAPTSLRATHSNSMPLVPHRRSSAGCGLAFIAVVHPRRPTSGRAAPAPPRARCRGRRRRPHRGSPSAASSLCALLAPPGRRHRRSGRGLANSSCQVGPSTRSPGTGRISSSCS